MVGQVNEGKHNVCVCHFSVKTLRASEWFVMFLFPLKLQHVALEIDQNRQRILGCPAISNQ